MKAREERGKRRRVERGRVDTESQQRGEGNEKRREMVVA